MTEQWDDHKVGNWRIRDIVIQAKIYEFINSCDLL